MSYEAVIISVTSKNQITKMAPKDLHSSMILFLEGTPARQHQSDWFNDRGDLVVLRHLTGADVVANLPEW